MGPIIEDEDYEEQFEAEVIDWEYEKYADLKRQCESGK